MLRFAIIFSVAVASCVADYEFVRGNLEDLSLQMKKSPSATGKKWALLVAGSSNYYNYRHQADVCHAYQVVSGHGIPDEQIVVMMYDDIANAPENPVKGELINHPDGPNVYQGVPKDYVGEDVTPDNFISILTGKKDIMKNVGSGKVIDSGPDDHVFVFFSDHGAPGLIAFPTERLYKDDLANAIKYMHTNKRYQQENLGSESLHKQYEITKAATNQSQVMQFGDMNMAKEPVGFFQGSAKVSRTPRLLRNIHDDVPSPDVKIHVLYNRIKRATSVEEQNELRRQLNEEYKMRDQLTNFFGGIADIASKGENAIAAMAMHATPKLNDMSCYKTVVEWFDRVCYDLDQLEFAYRKLYILANLCDAGVSTDDILSSISQMCK